MRTTFVVLLALAGCPGPAPVTPLPPDASDAAAPMGDASTYEACCASMHDVRPECPATLEHILRTHIAAVPEACKACRLGCP